MSVGRPQLPDSESVLRCAGTLINIQNTDRHDSNETSSGATRINERLDILQVRTVSANRVRLVPEVV